MTLRYARALLLAGVAGLPAAVQGQEPTQLDLGGQFIANGEGERYVRVLQLTGRVPMHPVGIRPFNSHEARVLAPRAAHPLAGRFGGVDSSEAGLRMRILRPAATTHVNGGAPQGEGMGAAWLGNGANAHLILGGRGRWGPLDAQVAPMAFWSQNAGFELADNGLSGDAALREARFPNNIDAPQRFGTGAYGRVDPGYSRIGVDTRYVSAGVSTSPLAWGPARNEPLVLGPNGGGFPHFFFGTGEPLGIGIGHIHAKFVTGRIEQSDWSPVVSGNRSRLATAVVLTLAPRGLTGLELGAVRFEHREWVPGALTLDALTRPFTSVFNDNTSGVNSGAENGYASAFARWAIVPAALELYAEYGREDYTGSLRTLVEKPDDLGNLLVGFQRVFGMRDDRFRVIRGELVNAELSANERGQRGITRPLPPYLHSGVRQGHTVNGQLLGSAMAYGGAGWTVALDTYATTARTTWSLERRLLRDYLPIAAAEAGRSPQVRYTVGGERVHWLPRGREFGVQASLTMELNQNTIPRQDRVLASVGVSWRGR